MVVASDVVYLSECLLPLLKSIKYFMRPLTGRCILVNNRIRQDLFVDRFEGMLIDVGLNIMRQEEVKYEGDMFKVYILNH